MSALTPPDGAEAIAAAARLAARLPSRTHHVMDSDTPVSGPMAVRIGTVTYPSLRKAARAHHVTIGAVQKWLDKGRAKPA